MQILLAITGASGTIYAQGLARKLIAAEQVSQLMILLSDTAQKVTAYELSHQWLAEFESNPKVKMLDNHDFFTSVASGSSAPDAMVILPCSMGMMARVAAGISNDLIARAADVMLKEGRKLIVAPRETPLSLIHLQNMVTLKQAGAVILPATPSFYSKPTTIEQLVNTVLERIIDQLQLGQEKFSWNPK